MIYRLNDSHPKKSRRKTSRVIVDEHDGDYDIINTDQPSGSTERYTFFFPPLFLIHFFFFPPLHSYFFSSSSPSSKPSISNVNNDEGSNSLIDINKLSGQHAKKYVLYYVDYWIGTNSAAIDLMLRVRRKRRTFYKTIKGNKGSRLTNVIFCQMKM